MTFSGPPRRKRHFLPMIRRRRERCTTTRFHRQPQCGFSRPPAVRTNWRVASLRSNTRRWIQKKAPEGSNNITSEVLSIVSTRQGAQQGVKRRHSVSCVRPSFPPWSLLLSTLPVSPLFFCVTIATLSKALHHSSLKLSRPLNTQIN